MAMRTYRSALHCFRDRPSAGSRHGQPRHPHQRPRHRQPHPRQGGRGRCLRPCQRPPSGQSEALLPLALALARTGRARRHRRARPRRPAGARRDARALSRALHPCGDLRGAARHPRRRARACRGHAAVRHRPGDAAQAGDPFRQLHRRQRAGLGHRRQVRRHQPPGHQHGAGPRPRENASATTTSR